MKTSTWINIFLASYIIWTFSPSQLKIFSEIGMMVAGWMLAWRFWDVLEKFNRKISDFFRGVILCCIGIHGFIDNDYIWFFYGILGQVYLLAIALWDRSRYDSKKLVITINNTDTANDTPEETYRKAHKTLV